MHPRVLAAFAILLAGCASAGVPPPPPSGPGPESPPPEAPSPEKASEETKARLRDWWDGEEALIAGGADDDAVREYRLRWLENLRSMQSDPRPADSEEAFEDAVIVLGNLSMGAEDGESAATGETVTLHRRSRDLLAEWHRRHPRSLRVGGMLDFVPPPSPDEEASHRAFLDAFAASSWEPTARGALMARAGLLIGPTEPGETSRADWEEVVRRWPVSFEARMARRHLAALALRPGTEPPPLDLPDLGGTRHSLAALRGEVILLTFFGIT